MTRRPRGTARMTVEEFRRHGHRKLPEAELQEQLRELCRARGLLHYHTHDSRRSEAGFPDSVVCGPGGVAFFELKREDGRVSAAQRVWIEGLRASGQLAAVIRPSDTALLIDLLDHLAQPTNERTHA